MSVSKLSKVAKDRFSMSDVKVSYYRGINYQYGGKTVSLEKLLMSKRHTSLINEIRKLARNGTDQYKELKKQLPVFTPEGIFQGPLKEKHLTKHSNLICMDIDEMQHLDLEQQKKEFAKLPYIAYCGLSCSGKGLFVLIRIRFIGKRMEHWRHIADKLTNLGFKVDTGTSNINRLRFISVDPAAYYNPFPKPYPFFTQNKKPEKDTRVKQLRTVPNTSPKSGKLDGWIKQIHEHKLDVTSNYEDWIQVGLALTSQGEAGRDLYHQISQYHPGYNPEATDRKYSDLLKSSRGKIGPGSIIYIIKKHLQL